jgi:hypothetical protein
MFRWAMFLNMTAMKVGVMRGLRGLGLREPQGRWRGPLAMLLLALSSGTPVVAQQIAPIDPAIQAQLTPTQLRSYSDYLRGRASFEQQLEMYWALVDERRDNRRRKHAAKLAYVTDDYVLEQPPKYTGPALSADIAKVVTTVKPVEPDKPLPNVAEFLESARAQFGFLPEPTTEREFKRRYALDALAAGLNKSQVVRVYALETGGRGTFDMQAGIDPVTRQGRPISSALGYAQLLSANSISELVRHGDGFIQRLNAMAAEPNVPAARAQSLQQKAQILRRMMAAAKSVPNEWRDHQAMGRTPPGLGIHTLNMDADIGPWLQVLKLKGLLATALSEAGRTSLTGAELELMNLAGPRTGLEMMQPVGKAMPTANFFAQAGYYRNTIVREKTGEQLLLALDQRMEEGLKQPGAIEFSAVFDEVLGGVARRPTNPAAPIAFGVDDVFRGSR